MNARLPVLILTLAFAACSPQAPEGVDKRVLDAAVAEAIGDPSTCVLIAERGGGQVYRFGTHRVCGRRLPACGPGPNRTVGELLDEAAAGRAFVPASCRSLARNRGVAWAAGPIAGRPLVYAAVMEGPNIPPGLVIADKLESAFERAGL